MLKKGLKFYYENKRKYKLKHGILYIRKQDKNDNIVKYWRIVVPDDKEIRNRILEETHSVPYAGHPSFNKTMEKINKYFYWEGISLDVRNLWFHAPCARQKNQIISIHMGSYSPWKYRKKNGLMWWLTLSLSYQWQEGDMTQSW